VTRRRRQRKTWANPPGGLRTGNVRGERQARKRGEVPERTYVQGRMAAKGEFGGWGDGT